MSLERHYEIRQTIINHHHFGGPVSLNIGIRHRDEEGKQIGPESGIDLPLTGPQFTRANPSARLTVNEDVVLAAAKTALGSQKVTFVVPPDPKDE